MSRAHEAQISLYRPQISAAATRYKLPFEIVAAVVIKESAGNPYAIRYEPDFDSRYLSKTKIITYGGITTVTERLARATSWGLMQVMGQVARELGCKEPYLSQLCDPATGLAWGCRKLATLRDRHFDRYGWEGVIAAYNAGNVRLGPDVNGDGIKDIVSINYAASVKSIAKDLAVGATA